MTGINIDLQLGAIVRFWRSINFRGGLFLGVAGTLVLVAASPVMMAGLTGTGLPWDRLADVGDAFGGASALLSAIALCGIGASLIFQQRQVRQDMVGMANQQHLELFRLAIEYPDLLEVFDGRPGDPRRRRDLYANMTMMYWLALWEFEEIDDDRLRALTADMFKSGTSRQWWARVGDVWIDTRRRPDRRRFLSIVSTELAAAEAAAAQRATTGRPATRAPAVALIGTLAAAGIGWAAGARMVHTRLGRRRDADG